MGFKSLFVVSDESSNDNQKKETPKVETSNRKFPTQEKEVEQEVPTPSIFGFNTTPTPKTFNSVGVTPEHVNKAIELYQNGFDSLNQPGFDFYEFYQSVTNGGVENPQIYSMAFAMGTAMDKSITKDKLLQQADFYTGEITKQYNEFVNQGNSKKGEIERQKTSENQSLLDELGLMEQQLEALKTQIDDRKRKLSAIGSKYDPMLNEIESKLSANQLAKNKIVDSIETVKTGIINTLK